MLTGKDGAAELDSLGPDGRGVEDTEATLDAGGIVAVVAPVAKEVLSRCRVEVEPDEAL